MNLLDNLFDALQQLQTGTYQTSQFFANVYMDRLDQYIKHQLKCRYYLRYADDFILLANTQQQLDDWQNRISRFLQQQLQLDLKQQAEPQPVSNGASFLGFIVRPYYILVRKRVVNNLTEKLQTFKNKLFPSKAGAQQATKFFRLQTELLQQLRAMLASYIGHCKHASSLKLIQSIWRKHPWLSWLYAFDATHWRLQEKYQPPSHFNFKQQIQFFRSNYPTATLLIQKGRQTVKLLPKAINAQHAINKIYITQTGFNKIGIQQRCLQQIQLR